MKNLKHTIKDNLKLVGIIVLFGVYSGTAFAQTNDSATFDDMYSMYKYNALENRLSYTDTLDTPPDNVSASTIKENREVINEGVTVVVQKSIIEEVNDILKRNNYSNERIANAMARIDKRTRLGTMVLGTDLGVLRFQSVQLKDQIYQLKILAKKTNITTERNQINMQIDLIAQEQNRVEDFVLDQENKFSLFRWFVSML